MAKDEKGKKKDTKKAKKKDSRGKDAIVYTIPLRNAFKVPRTRRAKKAVKIVKDFLSQHMKAEEIKLDKTLNEKIWERGIQKPPRRVKVKVSKGEGEIVKVTLA